MDSKFSGFEINADYRLGKRLYIAGELGFEEKTTKTDYLDASAKGNYFKAGIDYNLYNNWLGMENLIVSGLRFGVSQFSQTRERYTVYDTNSQTWSQIQNNESMEFSGLTASWVELIFGIKAELFNEAKKVLAAGERSGVSAEKLVTFHKQLQVSVSRDANKAAKKQTLSEKRKGLPRKRKVKRERRKVHHQARSHHRIKSTNF